MENSIKENVRSADKKPEIYVGADGKRAVRMVSVDREIVKKEDKKISLAKLQKLGSKGPNIFDKKTSLAKLQKLGSKGPKIFDGVEEGYLGSKGEKGRDKGNAGKFDKNTAYSHAKTHNGVVHKDTSGSYLVKHGRGKNVSEETVELDEAAINFRKAHQEIMAYAKKHGDIDKKDFEKVAYYLKAIGDNQNTPNVANRAFVTMKAFIAGMDTDPRDKVYLWLKKYGMLKNGKMVQEGVVARSRSDDQTSIDVAKRIAKAHAGNMTAAVKKIEKMKKGLSDHPQVQKHLRLHNEDLESVDEVWRKTPSSSRGNPFRSAQRSDKSKEAETEYDREKEYSRLLKQRKAQQTATKPSLKKESVNEIAPLVVGLAARGVAAALARRAAKTAAVAGAGALAKKAASVATVSLAKKAAKAVAVGAVGAAGAMGAKSLLSKDKDKNKKESIEQKSFSQFISELTDKEKADLAARKAKNVAKRGARRGPSKGTKSSEGDWTADQQKKAKPLGFEINKNDKHDAVHKTLAKAADASHPSLGGRKVSVKINGKSKEMAHKDLQHAVDLHKRLPLEKKKIVMNLIRDKGHDGIGAAAKHFRKKY